MKKRILTACLSLLMLMGTVPVSVQARDVVQTVSRDQTTLYVSGTRGDNESGNGSFLKPYKTLETAYSEMLDTGGDIVILDDAKAFDSHTKANKILPACEGEVRVHGEYNNGSYPSLDFSWTAGEGASVIYLGANTVFYDLTVKHVYSGAETKNLWFAAAFHDLTFGFNISMDITGGACVLTGAYHGNGISANEADDRSCNVNIYSGVFGNCFLGNYADKTEDGHNDTVTEDSVFNFYGGTVSNIYVSRNDTHGDKSFNANATVNMYGGKVNKAITVREELLEANSKSATLNLYNQAIATKGGAFESGAADVIRHAGKLVAPDYALAYCGVQSSAVEDGKYNVRFIGTVASLGFDDIGFEIQANGMDYTTSCKKVYSSVLGSVNGETHTYSASELGGNYVFAVAIKQIPQREGLAKFKITPFISVNGSKYYCQMREVNYNAGEYSTAEIAADGSIRIASLNLLNNENHGKAEYHMDIRMPRIINFINTELPDSIGVQECDSTVTSGNMRAKVNNGIADSGYVCAQEEQYSGSAYALKNFIWYNSKTTELLDSGQMWLSDTPDTPSKASDSRFYISAAWAILKNKKTGLEYVHINTHFDSDEADALRNANLSVLMPKVQYFIDAGYNVFLTGDFNSNTYSDVYKSITSKLDDARYIADNGSTLSTFNGLSNSLSVIDHCFCYIDKSVVNVDYFDVVEKISDGESAPDYMSDHNALLVDVSIYKKQ